MLWKVCLALAVAMVIYILLTNRAPAAPNRFDDWSEDEISMEGVVAIGLSLGDRLKSDQAVYLNEVRMRKSPSGDEQVVCGTFTLPGAGPAMFFGFGVGLSLTSTAVSEFEATMIGGNADMNSEIEVLCRTAGF